MSGARPLKNVQILAKYKEGDSFKRRNTLSISSIALSGKRGVLCKGLGAGTMKHENTGDRSQEPE